MPKIDDEYWKYIDSEMEYRARIEGDKKHRSQLIIKRILIALAILDVIMFGVVICFYN